MYILLKNNYVVNVYIIERKKSVGQIIYTRQPLLLKNRNLKNGRNSTF